MSCRFHPSIAEEDQCKKNNKICPKILCYNYRNSNRQNITTCSHCGEKCAISYSNVLNKCKAIIDDLVESMRVKDYLVDHSDYTQKTITIATFFIAKYTNTLNTEDRQILSKILSDDNQHIIIHSKKTCPSLEKYEKTHPEIIAKSSYIQDYIEYKIWYDADGAIKLLREGIKKEIPTSGKKISNDEEQTVLNKIKSKMIEFNNLTNAYLQSKYKNNITTDKKLEVLSIDVSDNKTTVNTEELNVSNTTTK